MITVKGLCLSIGLSLTGVAQAAVVNFDSLNAPGYGTSGLPLKNQLAASGVLFQNATAVDYSLGLPIPGFAHSGNIAVEMCYGVEFCAQPMTITFTTAERRVKVWVGASFALGTAQAVVLRAFDLLGNQLASSTATLGPSTGVIPVSVPIEVALPVPAGRIVRVTVGFLGAESPTPSMLNNGLAIDDLEFDVQGTPPTCSATQPPGLGVIAPVSGEIVVQNAFTADVNLSTPDPFATIQVRATGPGLQTNTFGPVFAAAGRVTLAGLTGLLFPGSNSVLIRATDCFGSTDRSATVVYRNDVTKTSILVIDDDDYPVPGAQVYADGLELGHTDQFGELAAPPLSDGTSLVARRFITESSTYRGNHSQGSTQNWKMHIYTTNVGVRNDGTLTRQPVKLEPDPLALQVIRVSKKNTLIGLHVVASVEWDASATELETIRQKLIGASRFLYNATDGQILIEQAEVVDNAAFWEDADYRVYANQHLRENVDCPLGGFFDDSFWCNGSWIHVQIKSDSPTYAHEFGHYGFDVGDEYSDDDASVECTARLGRNDNPPGPFQSGMPRASCMMYEQHQGVKLCSGRSENPHVHGTNQGDSSCWSTLIDHYKDGNSNPRWTIQSPDSRGAIMGQVNGANPPLPAWNPEITIDNRTHPNLCAPSRFIERFSDGTPAVGADVWLHTTYGANILQGKTGTDGQLTVTGIHIGDSINDFHVQPANCTSIAMFTQRRPSPLGVPVINAAMQSTAPSAMGQPAPIAATIPPSVFRIYASVTPMKDDSAQLLIWTETADRKLYALKQAPQVVVKPVGHSGTRSLPLRLVRSANGYVATIDGLPLDAEMGIEITAKADGNTGSAIARFQISRPDPGKTSDILSSDGQLKLIVPAGALPRGTRVAIGSSAAPPPPDAAHWRLLAGPFEITTTGNSKLAQPATIRFQFPHQGSEPAVTDDEAKTIRIVEYDRATGKWAKRGGVFHPFPVDVISLKTGQLGIFAVVAERTQ
jgi:hypothetical protein